MSGERAKLQHMALESAAFTLTERVDALAEALRAAGVSQEQAASLLASAATASMHALMLDAVLDDFVKPVPAEAETRHAERAAVRVQLAA
jgi:DNA-binding ferritin-like protein